MTIAAPFFGNKKRSFKTTFEIVIEPKLNFCVLKEKWEMNWIKLPAWNQMVRRSLFRGTQTTNQNLCTTTFKDLWMI